MKAKDFKYAADKHYKTCVFLFDKLDGRKWSNNHEISSNVYYLSGYIVECLLKYHILSVKHLSIVSDEQLEQLKLRDHCLGKLFNELKDITALPTEIPAKLPKHYNNWGPRLRYEPYKRHKDYVEDLYNQFDVFVRPLYNYISNR